MLFDWDVGKAELNKRQHGLSFEQAEFVFADQYCVVVYDRFEGGEHRWHAIGEVSGTCLLVVHTYPDPDREEEIRVISLRKATTHERRRYEEGDFDRD